MCRILCRIIGVALLLVGLAGFALPHLLGMHLTTIHNVVHLLTGLIALYVGFAATFEAARVFCLVFGAVLLIAALMSPRGVVVKTA